MAAERLGVPLFRVGFPIFDRLGVQDRSWVGYRGTRALVYELANVFQSQLQPHTPADFARSPEGLHTAQEHGHA
jgi:nitrogenase molybdenum-iron protein NifN